MEPVPKKDGSLWAAKKLMRLPTIRDVAREAGVGVGTVVVVAKYVMVDKNLPDDRRDLDLLMSIMRQCPYYTQWTQSVWKCPVLMQGLRRLSRVTTPTTIHGRNQTDHLGRLPGTDEPARSGARVRRVAWYGAALGATTGG